MGAGPSKSTSKRRLAVERARVLRPLLPLLVSDKKSLQAYLKDAAKQLGVSVGTARKMLRRLEAGDGRASALEPQSRGPKRGGRRLDPQVEAIIDTCLRKRYLVRERPSFLRIVLEIRLECTDQGLTAPTRRTIKSRLDRMDQRAVVRKRNGAKAAREQFASVGGVFERKAPLEVIQIDHTLGYHSFG